MRCAIRTRSQGLILEGPAGLEEYPKNFKMGDKELPICDKSIAYDLNRWNAAYEPLGLVEAELKRTPQAGARLLLLPEARRRRQCCSPRPAGYFVNDTEYARLHTDQRIAMITGNKREFEQWAFMFHLRPVLDLLGKRAAKTRTRSTSVCRQIKAPIFLAFGAKEPFIPSTALNGLDRHGQEHHHSLQQRMTAAGNPPLDQDLSRRSGTSSIPTCRYEFAKDTVNFMKTRHVDACRLM